MTEAAKTPFYGLTITSVFLLLAVVGLVMPADVLAWTSPEAAAAAKANPELATALSKEIGGTADEAAGAAGAMFSLAKTRLKPEEFSQVAKAVPAMDLILKAAPAAGAAPAGPAGALAQAAGTVGSIPAVASAFGKMGISPQLAPKVASALVSYVTKTGGTGVAGLLAGVLK